MVNQEPLVAFSSEIGPGYVDSHYSMIIVRRRPHGGLSAMIATMMTIVDIPSVVTVTVIVT